MSLFTKKIDRVPQFVSYFAPVLEILRDLGGRARTKQVYAELATRYDFTPEELAKTNPRGMPYFQYQAAWAASYLRRAGLMSEGEKGLWELTEEGFRQDLNDEAMPELYRKARAASEQRKDLKTAAPPLSDLASQTKDPAPPQAYTLASIRAEGCFLPESELTHLFERLRDKQNLILQGPPGTGKTWLAKRLAKALIGSNDANLRTLRVIQCHPSLSYEDVVRGYRPSSDGKLLLKDGVFLRLIQDALSNPEIAHVLIMEEINRGHPAQMFGEILTLLETTKRTPEDALQLAYPKTSDERIYIPPNVYVIGTMNVADRSLAPFDLALRRRFAFVTLKPCLNQDWETYVAKAHVAPSSIAQIRRRLEALNTRISQHPLLGPQFAIGHSYVTPLPNSTISAPNAWFQAIVDTELSPLLQEYWFDDPQALNEALSDLKAPLD